MVYQYMPKILLNKLKTQYPQQQALFFLPIPFVLIGHRSLYSKTFFRLGRSKLACLSMSITTTLV